MTLLVLTPWYPTPQRPYEGVFVRASLAALGPAIGATLVHVRAVPLDQPFEERRGRDELGELIRLDLPVAPSTPRTEVARLHRARLRDAQVVRRGSPVLAHVGMPSGWAVSGLLDPADRLVVIEHASYLWTVLRDPEGHARYGEMLARATWLLMPTEHGAAQVRRQFPEHAARIGVLGNPVDGSVFTARAARPERLDRWVCVGNLTAHKRVVAVLDAFAAFRADVPEREAHLTFAGEGPERAALVARAEALGLADRVTLLGSVDVAALPDLLARCDVLIHLSAAETFGLSVVEAAVSGLPVVVTRCGGPEETLAGADVAFVPNPPTALDVLSAVRDLEGASPGGHEHRERILARHGVEAYRARLTRALSGLALDEPGDGPVVCAVVTGGGADGPQARAAAVSLGAVLRAGGRALLVAGDPAVVAGADRRIQVLDLTAGAPAADRMLRAVGRSAVAGCRVAGRALGRLGRWRGPVGRLARRGVGAVGRLLAAVERRTDRLRERDRAWMAPAVQDHADWFVGREPELWLVGAGAGPIAGTAAPLGDAGALRDLLDASGRGS